MVIVQLLASPFVGGIERQVLGLACHLPAPYRTVFLSFAEHGRARPFLELARQNGADRAHADLADFYRAVHSLTGHAASAGFTSIAHLCAALEALLKELQEKIVAGGSLEEVFLKVTHDEDEGRSAA